MLALLALIPVQEAPPASPSPAQLEEVEVVGRRGAARVAPEQELGPEEIDNLGAYDIGEVIARLSERLGFQQPPVVIVNGRPVVDARNFTGFPPDAL
ncbi:MAG: TonB-dependent receptor, partial [Brevundimonas sp.]|nr:TonB-dependent receptor [Brevundimonas sp.]